MRLRNLFRRKKPTGDEVTIAAFKMFEATLRRDHKELVEATWSEVLKAIQEHETKPLPHGL